MSRVPTPGEIVGVNRERELENRERQRAAEERESRDRAEAEVDKIAATLRRDGMALDGMRYRVPSSLRWDFRAVDAITRRLETAGWKVVENPDDEDDFGHRRHVEILLIRAPAR